MLDSIPLSKHSESGRLGTGKESGGGDVLIISSGLVFTSAVLVFNTFLGTVCLSLEIPLFLFCMFTENKQMSEVETKNHIKELSFFLSLESKSARVSNFSLYVTLPLISRQTVVTCLDFGGLWAADCK